MPKRTRTNHRELSTRGLTGHELRRIQKLNGTLRRTRKLVAKSDDSDSPALLLAETRVLVLKMGRYEFGRVAGMHFHAVKNVETPGSHPQHESHSRVYRAWDRLAHDQRKSPVIRKRLIAASEKLLNLLVPEHDEHDRPLRPSVDGLYRVWMYQVGRTAFEAASRKTNRQRLPLTYGTLWQRREVGMVPDFEEVRLICQHLKRDLASAAEVWSQQKTDQLLGRGTPAPLGQLVVAIQIAYPGLWMTTASLRKHLNITDKTARAINNGQLVPFDDVRRVVADVIPARAVRGLKRSWMESLDRLGAQEDFTTAFPRICDENGWNNHMLATLLRVRPPEERHVLSSSKHCRTEPYRPSAEIRRMYRENAFSSQAPAKAAIDLVANEKMKEGDRGENQRQYLTRLFLEGVERRLMQKGSSAHASPVRWHRTLCGVSPEQLADLSGYSKEDILHIERRLLAIGAAEVKELVGLMDSIPAEKTKVAQGHLTELTSPPKTVAQVVTRLRDRHGGYVPLSNVLHDESDRRLNVSPVHLKRIERGQDIPPLPLLKHLITRGGAETTDELVHDWYSRMPNFLVAHRKLRWRHPLVRGFGMVIFERWHSLHDFWKEQFQDDFTYSIVTRNFQQLNGHGYGFPWTTVSRYLNAAGIPVSHPRRQFLQQLFNSKDEITDAIEMENEREAAAVVHRVLRRWRKTLRSRKIDCSVVETTLGLTNEERSSN